jgi:hypothetical protein
MRLVVLSYKLRNKTITIENNLIKYSYSYMFPTTWGHHPASSQNIYRTYIEHIQNIHRTYTKHTRYIYRTYTEHTQNIYRTYTEYIQNIHRTYTVHIQNIYISHCGFKISLLT